MQACEDGQWAAECAGEVTPQTEICDGSEDEDCDGQIDEGCDCANGKTRECGKMVGECRQGTNTCEDGKWSTTCEGETPPGKESCDGKDNDCDGQTDEQLLNKCGGCMKLSNDVGSTCSAGLGNCLRLGEYVCDGMNATRCDAQPGLPQRESCNFADDDCDGFVDNGLENACGGSCMSQFDGRPGDACTVGSCGQAGKMQCSLTLTSLRCVPCSYSCVDSTNLSVYTATDLCAEKKNALDDCDPTSFCFGF